MFFIPIYGKYSLLKSQSPNRSQGKSQAPKDGKTLKLITSPDKATCDKAEKLSELLPPAFSPHTNRFLDSDCDSRLLKALQDRARSSLGRSSSATIVSDLLGLPQYQ